MGRKKKTELVSAAEIEKKDCIKNAVIQINDISKEVDSKFLEVGKIVYKAIQDQPEKLQRDIMNGIITDTTLKVSPSLIKRAYYTVYHFKNLLTNSPRMPVSNYELLSRNSKLGAGVLIQLAGIAETEKLSCRQLAVEIKKANSELKPEMTKLVALLSEIHKLIKQVHDEKTAKDILGFINIKLPQQPEKVK